MDTVDLGFRPESVREVMRAEGIGVHAFGRRIGVTGGSVCGYLSGQVSPQLATLCRMAREFNRPLEFWLTTCQGEPAPAATPPPRFIITLSEETKRKLRRPMSVKQRAACGLEPLETKPKRKGKRP